MLRFSVLKEDGSGFFAEMAELADARDLKSLGPKARPGSIPGLGTIIGKRDILSHKDAGWSSLVARWAHNPKVAGSNPAPATNSNPLSRGFFVRFLICHGNHSPPNRKKRAERKNRYRYSRFYP
jgi:hypothetical protein